MEENVNMSVSPICEKDGKKYAYVTFEQDGKKAEGQIPDCKIEKYEGFTEDEVKLLELYMKTELKTLKKTAASVNVFDAFLKG
ncbi:MAG: hypothetical protein K6A69_07430 [Lachnospiraceae bacterium]|nr:hypothetical protein [Lachnospiraceae bacterium]